MPSVFIAHPRFAAYNFFALTTKVSESEPWEGPTTLSLRFALLLYDPVLDLSTVNCKPCPMFSPHMSETLRPSSLEQPLQTLSIMQTGWAFGGGMEARGYGDTLP